MVEDYMSKFANETIWDKAKEACMILMLIPAAMLAVGLLSWIFFNDGAVQ